MSGVFIKPVKVISIFYFLFLIPLFSATNVAADDFTAATIGDYGNITVMEVEGNYDARLPDGTLNEEPRQTIAKEFYRLHEDEYDFLVIFTNFDFQMPEEDIKAFYHPVKNDVKGIGVEIFDYSDLYGSKGKLQGIIDMGNIAKSITNPFDPAFEVTLSTLSHEMLHRWAAYVRFIDEDGNVSTALLGKDASHWSYLLDTDGSVLYGNDWQDNGDGTFTSVAIKKNYSPLDLYLMGFVDKTQVPPMLLINNPSIDPTQLPEKDVTIIGEPQYITIEDIIAVEGERIPDASNSQKSFKMAFILLTLPGTFRVEEVYKLENLRNKWITRFSILTDGDGVIQVTLVPKEEIPKNPGITPPELKPRTLPPNIEDGVKWLMRHQEVDGSWVAIDQTVDRDTAEAVLALKNFEVAKENYNKGLQWLDNIESGNMDYLSRKVEVFVKAGKDVTQLIGDIISRQNSDGGWGSNDNYMSNPVDTSFALSALALSDYTDNEAIMKAIEYLKSKQNSDGGWGSNDEGSTIQATTNVLMAFNRYRQKYQLDNQIEKGIAWLLEHQNPDGGFGNSPSTVYDTALAVLTLREFNISTDITNRGLNYILSKQSGSGSWYGSPYQTALAVRAVWKANIDPDLSIKTEDITFIPSKVMYLPSDVIINAKIWNLGRTSVSQAKVALYEGAVTEDSKVAEQVVAFPGQSSTTVTFSVSVRDGDQHTYFIVVDPDDSVEESNEQNNSAVRVLYPEPTYDFVISPSDISLSSNKISIFDDLTITSKITNRGTTDVYNVQVRYFIDLPEEAYEIATLTVDVPAGETITSEYTWKADKEGVNLPLTVEVDPFNRFLELSEDNNRASIALTVEGVAKPNLTVSYKDLVISPEPAMERGSVSISVSVKNTGFSPAQNVVVEFYLGTPGVDGVLIGRQNIDTIGHGESRSISFLWQDVAASGKKIVFVKVDPDNLIEEIKEDDNDAFKTIKILSLPDLAISTNSIVFSPSAPKDGDSVFINVTVNNIGEQDASDVTVEAYEGSTLIGTGIIPLISGNAEDTISFLYDTSGKKGFQEITIKVDPANLIIERSEDNNQASRVLGVQDADLWVSEPYISPNGDGIKDSTDFFFRLKTPQTVRIVVVDKKGRYVREFAGDELIDTTGTTITWDGLNNDGTVVTDGQYSVEVIDTDGNVLGSLPVVVDNNRLPLTDAIGTEYLMNNNLTCMLPQIDPQQWQWLPDESGIVFSIDYTNTNAPEYPAGIYVMSPHGKDILRLIPFDWTENNPDYMYYDFRFYLSPDGEKVAFTFLKFDRNTKVTTIELWMVDINGEKLIFLHNESYKNRFLNIKWSPDSKYISYINIASGNYELWLINVETIEKVKVDSFVYYEDCLEWSSDGKEIAYCRYDANINEDVLMVSDTSGNKKSISIFNDLPKIFWFQNQKILFQNNGLWFMDASEKGNHVKISDYVNKVFIAPNKKIFAFTIESNNGMYLNIADINGDTYTIHEIKSQEQFCVPSLENISWSSDSKKIAFLESISSMGEGPLCNETYGPNILVIDLKTKEKKKIKTFDYPDYMLYPALELVGWLSDNVSVISKDYMGIYITNFITSVTESIVSEIDLLSPLKVSISPLQRYITYYRPVSQSSLCYGRGYDDLWAISSLLNMTVELRIRKERTGIILKGIATDLNFEGYSLEYADVRNPDKWSLIRPPSDIPVINDVFTTWVPPYEGRFYIRLTAWDRAGNVLQKIKQVSWGQFTSITGLYKTEDIFSPNGDGVKDTVELHYRVLQPVYLEFYVYNENLNSSLLGT